MTTSHPEFNANTEALEVAKTFPDRIHGKTIIVTGVNRKGIGFATAEAFASQSPAHLIFAGRSLPKLQESIDAIKKTFPHVDCRTLQIDLSSQSSVRSAAAEILSWDDVPAIDVVVNSAAIAHVTERTLTEDGIEIQFATTHIGHFLLTCLIMPKLLKAATLNPTGATRVVNVTSRSPLVAHMRWSDMNFEKVNKTLPEEEQPNYNLLKMWGAAEPENMSYVPIEGYNQGKVANVLFGIALTRRLYEKYGILSLSLHPGVIENTELGRDMPPEIVDSFKQMVESGHYSVKTLGAGAATSLVAALDPELRPGQTVDGKEQYGTYLSDCQISDGAHPLAVSSVEAEKLWDLSEKLVKEKFSW